MGRINELRRTAEEWADRAVDLTVYDDGEAVISIGNMHMDACEDPTGDVVELKRALVDSFTREMERSANELDQARAELARVTQACDYSNTLFGMLVTDLHKALGMPEPSNPGTAPIAPLLQAVRSLREAKEPK